MKFFHAIINIITKNQMSVLYNPLKIMNLTFLYDTYAYWL